MTKDSWSLRTTERHNEISKWNKRIWNWKKEWKKEKKGMIHNWWWSVCQQKSENDDKRLLFCVTLVVYLHFIPARYSTVCFRDLDKHYSTMCIRDIDKLTLGSSQGKLSISGTAQYHWAPTHLGHIAKQQFWCCYLGWPI